MLFWYEVWDGILVIMRMWLVVIFLMDLFFGSVLDFLFGFFYFFIGFLCQIFGIFFGFFVSFFGVGFGFVQCIIEFGVGFSGLIFGLVGYFIEFFVGILYGIVDFFVQCFGWIWFFFFLVGCQQGNGGYVYSNIGQQFGYFVYVFIFFVYI